MRLHVPNVMEIWEPKSPGTLWAIPGLLRDTFTFTFIFLYTVSINKQQNFDVVNMWKANCRSVNPVVYRRTM